MIGIKRSSETKEKCRQFQLKRFSNPLEIEKNRQGQIKSYQEHPERREKLVKEIKERLDH